jgi:L-threonylcarbamoyladenylate synthase
VLPKKEQVPDLVTAGLPSVALRVPSHPIALELLRAFGAPLAAPSANPFGQVSPTTAEHVRSSLGRQVDLILDGGPCAVGVESTVLSLLDETPVLLRPGGISLEDLKKVAGKIRVPADGDGKSLSPGRQERHYATRTPLYPADHLPVSTKRPRLGYLAFRDPPSPQGGLFVKIEVLSPSGDLREASANLFSALRRLDAEGLDAIAYETAPETGLGRAINDRLRRASAKT